MYTSTGADMEFPEVPKDAGPVEKFLIATKALFRMAEGMPEREREAFIRWGLWGLMSGLFVSGMKMSPEEMGEELERVAGEIARKLIEVAHGI